MGHARISNNNVTLASLLLSHQQSSSNSLCSCFVLLSPFSPSSLFPAVAAVFNQKSQMNPVNLPRTKPQNHGTWTVHSSFIRFVHGWHVVIAVDCLWLRSGTTDAWGAGAWIPDLTIFFSFLLKNAGEVKTELMERILNQDSLSGQNEKFYSHSVSSFPPLFWNVYCL